MKPIIKILFLFLVLSLPVKGQENKLILKLDKPGFVPVDSVYQFSMLLSNKIHQASSINFYLFLDEGVDVESIVYSNWEHQIPLEPKPSVYLGYYGKTVKTIFSDFDSTRFLRSNSQLTVDLRARYIKETEIGFAFELMEADSIIESYSSFGSEYEEHNLPIMDLEFYIPQNYSGNCLQIDGGSRFVVNPDLNLEHNRMLLGFWAKVSSSKQTLLNVLNEQYQDTLLSLSIGDNQNILVPEEVNDVNLSNLFIADRSWNYYAVLFDYNYNEIKFYLNGKPSFILDESIDANTSVKLELVNTGLKSMLIDNLGLYDFGNKMSRLKNNLNYVKVISDSSKQIYFESFDNIEDEDLIPEDSYDYRVSTLKVVDSDAPVFSRLPELYINSFENFNEVIWSNSDDNVVAYYVLEKSIDGRSFTEVGTKVSDSDPDKEYSLLDQRNIQDEIVYYRVKIVNNDESILYSPALKLGQAKQENFLIEQNYPNPFNPLTTTSIEVLTADEFDVVVYDLVGNKILTVYNGVLEEGIHRFDFDGSNLPSGIYFLEVSSKSFTQAIKMILAK